MAKRNGINASAFMAMRSRLLTVLMEIDSEIDKVLSEKKSQRSLDRARALFLARSRMVDELSEYGVEADPHPAVENQ